MSASMRVRVPPTAPRQLEVMETERVETLVWEALFGGTQQHMIDPHEAMSSTDEGMTGGVLLQAKGSGRHFLDGALMALEQTDPAGEATEDLRDFLRNLDEHGALLITMER